MSLSGSALRRCHVPTGNVFRNVQYSVDLSASPSAQPATTISLR